jgi:hypothetical protein
MQAELDALDNRKPEIVPFERRLDDPRLEKHHNLIRGARDASLRLWGTQFEIPDRPAPTIHPMIERLAAKQHDEISMGEMIGHIIAAERAGRAIAGMGLIQLKTRHEAAIPGELNDGERTWLGLIATHFSFDIDRVNELMGRWLHRGGSMACTKCGKEQVCPCGCGVAYWPEAVAKDVTENVTDNSASPVNKHMPNNVKHLGRGRPSTGGEGSAGGMTPAERKRRSRERQRSAAATPPPLPRFATDELASRRPGFYRLPKALAGSKVEGHAFHSELLSFSAAFWNVLMNYHRRNFTAEDRALLMDTLHGCANDMHLIAQSFVEEKEESSNG